MCGESPVCTATALVSFVASVTDGNSVRIDYVYDKLDRVVAISKAGQTVQANTYDALGNLTDRAVPGSHTGFQWAKTSAASQVISSQRFQGTAVENVAYTYDAANRLISLLDPFGQTTTFGYDNADRRTNTTFPGAGTQTNGYDNSGRQTSNSSFTYSSTNQLLTGSSNGQQLVTASCDTADQAQRRTVTEKIGTTTFSYTFGQTALGTLQVVGNGARISYSRDTNGTLITEKAASGVRYNLITDYLQRRGSWRSRPVQDWRQRCSAWW
jgi:YD repeat-containing protein